MIFRSKTGRSVPSPLSLWQQWRKLSEFWRSPWLHGPRYSCRPVPYCQIWTNCTILDRHHDTRYQIPEDLKLALVSLSIPIEGPVSLGVSLQEAIQVNQRHETQKRQYPNPALISYSYTISFPDIVYYILFDIVLHLISYTIIINVTISYKIWFPLFDASNWTMLSFTCTRQTLQMSSRGIGKDFASNVLYIGVAFLKKGILIPDSTGIQKVSCPMPYSISYPIPWKKI